MVFPKTNEQAFFWDKNINFNTKFSSQILSEVYAKTIHLFFFSLSLGTDL